jgi:hypothetical protein
VAEEYCWVITQARGGRAAVDRVSSMFELGFQLDTHVYAKVVDRVMQPIPVAKLSEAWDCGPWLSEIIGSNPTGDMDVCVL